MIVLQLSINALVAPANLFIPALRTICMPKKDMPRHPGMMCVGIGIFIFGLVKYLGYSWEMAFMVLGVLAFLKGLLCFATCKCK